MGRTIKVSVQCGQVKMVNLTTKKKKVGKKPCQVLSKAVKVSFQTGGLRIVPLKKVQNYFRKPIKIKFGSTQLEHLPNEIIHMILKKVSKRDLSNTALVCRRLRDLCKKPDLWNLNSIEIRRKNFQGILECTRLQNVVKVSIVGNFVDKQSKMWNVPTKEKLACWSEEERLACYQLLLALPRLREVQGGLWHWLVWNRNNRNFGRMLKPGRQQVWNVVDTLEIAPSLWPGIHFSRLMNFTNRMRNLTKLVIRDPDSKSKDSSASLSSFACWDVPETSTTLLKLSDFRVDGGNLSGTQLQQLFDIFLSSENIRKVGIPEARLKSRVSPEQILAVSKKLIWIDLRQAKLDKDQMILLRSEVKAGKVVGWRQREKPPPPPNNLPILMNIFMDVYGEET